MFKKNFFLLSFFILALFFFNKILIDNRINETVYALKMISNNASDRLDSAKALVEIASISKDVSTLPAIDAEWFLRKIVRSDNRMWSHFLMTDKVGIEYVHTEGDQYYGVSLANRDYFYVPNSTNKTIIALPIHSVSTGRKIIAIGTPVYENMQKKAVLVGFIHLHYVSAILNENFLSSATYITMINPDGTISAHPNDLYVLSKKFSEVYSKPLQERILQEKSGYTIAFEKNTPYLFTYMPLKQLPLIIISVAPLLEVFSSIIIINIILLVILGFFYLLYRFRKKLHLTTKYAQRMENQATIDKLTGLKNRRYLENISIEKFCQDSFCVIFFDIDDFKYFNDLHDHNYGDNVLRFVGKNILLNTRPEKDVGIRYGGDEFLILLKDTQASDAEKIAQRLQELLAQYVDKEGIANPIYISCGISCGQNKPQSLATAIVNADKAVYKSKNAGKNTLTIHTEDE